MKNLNEIDLADIDFSNIGNWPLAGKISAIAGLCAALFVGGYMLDTSVQLDNLDTVAEKETELRQLYELKQAKAANLAHYKKQLEDIQRTFGTLLSQLPSKTEVADLLTDITQTGLSNGLEFEFFKPQSEIPKEFYVELPIQLKVKGQYHEFGKFMSSVASLPRIVTIHDFTITKAKENTKKGRHKKGELILEAEAKTYRYLDEKELASLNKVKK